MTKSLLYPPFRHFSRRWKRSLLVSLCLGIFPVLERSWAQTPIPPITPSGFNTQVSAPKNLPDGTMQYNITGGTRPGGGGNLFHSFGKFGVPTEHIANFSNDSGLPTNNILNRVTGGTPSNIFGTIQTEGFGKANLFLMNPAGIVFGPNASLNVGGAAHFTTADYLRLDDGAQFTALPSEQDSLLSIAPVEAFGFLGPNPAAISVTGSALSVSEGQPLSLVGGNITISHSSLRAPGGTSAIASVASPGEILATSSDKNSGNQCQPVSTFGAIRVLDESTIDASGEQGGTVLIRGGRLVLDQGSQIHANTVGTQDHGRVTVEVRENVVIAGTGVEPETPSGIFANTEGAGQGGEITISATNVKVTDGGRISTSTRGSGDAGSILITASDGELMLSGGDNPLSEWSPGEEAVGGLFANTMETGRAGSIKVQTGNLIVSEGARLSAGTFGRGSGDAGKIMIEAAGDVLLSGTHANGSAPSGFYAGAGELTTAGEGLLGSGGKITVTGETVQIMNGAKIDVASKGQEHPDLTSLEHAPSAGTVNIETAMLDIAGAEMDGNVTDIVPSGISASASGPASAGHILLEADNIIIRNGGVVTAETTSLTKTKNIGSIQIAAEEDLAVSGVAVRTEYPPELLPDNPVNPRTIAPSGIRAQTTGVNRGGNIRIQAENVSVTGGGVITNAAMEGEGAGGNIQIDVADTLRLSGAYEKVDKNRTIFRSEIASGTLGPGQGGEITITAKNVALQEGGRISSTTRGRGSGNAGRVSIAAAETVSITGIKNVIDPETNNTSKTRGFSSKIITSAADGRNAERNARNIDKPIGLAGDVSLTAKKVVMKDGATIGATSASGRVPILETLLDTISKMPKEHRPRAGNITIIADHLTVTGWRAVEDGGKWSWNPTTIKAGATGMAGTGNVSLEANNIIVSDGANISAETQSRTPGVQRGAVTLTAHENLTLSGYLLRTDFPENPVGSDPVPLANGRTVIPTRLVARTSGTNQAGDIILSAQNLEITDGAQIANGAIRNHQLENAGGGGKILLAADTITLSGMAPFPDALGRPLPSIISSSTEGPAYAGQIDVASKAIEIKNGAQISASSIPLEHAIGAGGGGNIQVMATERFLADGVGILEERTVVPSGIFSSTEKSGPGGSITVISPRIDLHHGAAINAAASGTGNAGNITIKTEAFTSSNSRISSSSSLDGPDGGAAGNVTVTSDGTVMSTGSEFSTRSSTGKGGEIQLFGGASMTLDSTTVSAEVEAGENSGGSITIHAGTTEAHNPGPGMDLFLRNGTTVTAESSGLGDAGSINLEAGDTIRLENAVITTEALQASGGNIKFTAPDTIQIQDSTVASSVKGNETTKGGNINLDPDSIVLQNSEILAKAEEGKGGDINLIANEVVLVDPFSVVDASAETGVNGTVGIDAPTKFLSGTIAPLPQSPQPVTNLYSSKCMAGKDGNFSSFVNSQAEGVAPVPGTYLASPFLPFSSNVAAINFQDMPSEVSKKNPAAPVQVATYSPPILFGQATGGGDSCRP